MKSKMMVLATIFIVSTMVTPVLAGKGMGGSSRLQYKNGMSNGTGTMLQSQTQQRNQYRYQKSQPSDASVNQTRSQLRTRDPLTHTTVSTSPLPTVNTDQ